MRALAMGTALALLPATAVAQTYLVLITGLGGEPRYRAVFHETAVTLADAAVERHGVRRDRVTYLGARPALDPARITARSTKDTIAMTLGALAERAESGAAVVIVLIGHGSESGGRPRFNLPGPDLTAQELATLLDRFPTQRVIVVNTTSASGGWIGPLSAPNRTIVTATRSGIERNESHFGTQFAAAFASDDADTDQNGRTSILEAFEYARREVRRIYESNNRLLTEHALLDDNGDGEGSLEPDVASGDGALAARLFLDDVSATADSDPAVMALAQQRDSLEREVEELRARRASMDETAYERALERLLLAVARVGHALRERREQ